MQPQIPPKIPHPHVHTHFHSHCSHAPTIHHHHHHHHHHPILPHIHIPHLLVFHHHHYPHPFFHPLNQVFYPQEQVAPSSAIGLEQENSLENKELEEEDADDVFVMTDEWKEFFAKSEAKRRLKKQQQKKGGK